MFNRSPFSRRDLIEEDPVNRPERGFDKRQKMSVSPARVRDLSPHTVTQKKKMLQSGLGAVNMKEEFYMFKIMNIVDQADHTVCLKFDIPEAINETARYLDIDVLKTQLLGYTHDYPTVMNLGCTELSGYSTTNNMATHVVSTSSVTNLALSASSGTIVSHNILYSNGLGQPVWDISNIPSLTFYLTLDIEPTAPKIQLPLTQPVWLCFKIVRVIL